MRIDPRHFRKDIETYDLIRMNELRMALLKLEAEAITETPDTIPDKEKDNWRKMYVKKYIDARSKSGMFEWLSPIEQFLTGEQEMKRISKQVKVFSG